MSRLAASGAASWRLAAEAGGMRRVARTLRWYVRQFTGEAKWDDYLADCAARGVVPMSRREFERHRADHAERNPGARCC